MKILKIISGIILGIGLLILLFAKSCSKDKDEPEKKDKGKTESIEYHWVIDTENTKTIYFNGEYGIEYLIPKKVGFSFEESTQPYCSMNASENFACGEKGEDISSKLPKNVISNSAFRFKSSNGENGQLDLVIWKLVKIKNCTLN